MSFYRACREELDQGDLVDAVPWGMVEPPVTICRPSNATAPTGRARYAPAAEVDRPFSATNSGIETVHVRAKCGPVLVLWHGCEIDASLRRRGPARAFAAVAPVRSLGPTIPHEPARHAIREGRRRAFFHLPPVESFNESYVDLRQIWNVPQAILTQRRVALGSDAIQALHVHLFQFLTRRDIQIGA